MKRAIFITLNSFSILLLVLSVGLCIYSIFSGKLATRQAAYSTADGTSHSSVLGAGVTEGWSIILWIDVPFGTASGEKIQWQTSEITMEEIVSIETDLQPTSTRMPGFILYQFKGVGPLAFTGWMIAVHFGWLIPLLSILPTFWLLTRHKEPRRRARLGLCIKCGYDLRGSETGVCPECGAVK